MKIRYYWGEDLLYRKDIFVDYMDPVFYYGRQFSNDDIIPFVRPIENKITLSMYHTYIELDFSFEWDIQNKTWKKVQVPRKIKIG